MNIFKKIIFSTPITKKLALKIRHFQLSFLLYVRTARSFKKIQNDKPKIFYLGIPAHSNLGDLAQGICIRSWLKKHYPERQIVEVETNALVNTPFSLLKKMAALYKSEDIIVFQSGYTTTDLGGFADEMHRAVMSALPDAKMLMLPQTVFFLKEENEKRTSIVYNSMKNMLFLARDRVSFDTATKMLPDVPVMLFPDIVTTLIGKYSFDSERSGIMLCCRNDEEKYYSDEEISALIQRCKNICPVEITDTTKPGKTADVVKNAEKLIKDEIERYSRFKLIITDRYHGTILSLVAGTPVIIIKTTDHKVVTGAEWFKGVYDDYVHVASSTSEAFEIAKTILKKDLSHALPPYFEAAYYDKLRGIFEQNIR